MDVVGLAVKAAPEFCSFIVGAAKIVIRVAIDFVEFFSKLSEMLGRLGDHLGHLAEYAKAATDNLLLVHGSVAKAYEDVLEFCRKARNVFFDAHGNQRKWLAFRTFLQIQWEPFESEFGSIEVNLQHHLNVLQHAALAAQLNENEEVRRERQRVKLREEREDREKFLKWISTIDFEKIHREIYAKKHKGTGDWLLQDEEFEKWLTSSTSSLLWCHGTPGVGKSVLASNVLEFITARHGLDDDVAISFVYYSYRMPELGDPDLVLGAFTKQLCRKMPSTPDWLLKHKQNDSMSNACSLESFISLSKNKKVFIVMDALDECPAEVRPEILGIIFRLLTCHDMACIKIFVTSRRESNITNTFEQKGIPTIQVEARNINRDTTLYVHDEVKRLRNGIPGKQLFLQNDDLEINIIAALTQKADGMFLWTQLQLENLCVVSTRKRDKLVKEALDKLPKGLNATYERIMKTICDQPETRELARRTFRWIIWAKRPLTMDELKHALTVCANTKDNNAHETKDDGTIISACRNLIVEEAGYLKLIHFSLKEFLLDAQSLVLNIDFESITDPKSAHNELAYTCLIYILERTPEFSSEIEANIFMFELSNPFVRYAFCFFDSHALHGYIQGGPVDKALERLFTQNNTLAEITLVRGRYIHYEWGSSGPEPISVERFISNTLLFSIPAIRDRWFSRTLPKYGLHSASRIGNIEGLRIFLEKVDRVDEVDEWGCTPMYHAARNGHVTAVSLLIDYGADVNPRSQDYGPPLHVAAANRHWKTVELLLERGADVNRLCKYHRSVLQIATYYKNLKAIKLLLDKGADVNLAGGSLGNPLQAAAAHSAPEVLKLLLDQGADINAQGGSFGSALQAAAYTNNVEVTKLLLSRGADINAEGGEYGSALQAAAYCGNLEVTKLLLDGGATIYAKEGGIYASALQAAAYKNRLEVAKLLLDEGADINFSGGYFGNALQAAAYNVHADFVEMLLDHGADVNAKGGEYSNALQAAIEGQSELVEGARTSIVDQLLKAGADVNMRGVNDETTLHVAARRSKYEMVQLMLEKGAHFNARNASGETALQLAVKSSNYNIVQFLLEKGADFNARCASGENALDVAVRIWSVYLATLRMEGADDSARSGFAEAQLGLARSLEEESPIAGLLRQYASLKS